MPDIWDKQKRSEVMSKIRGTGNKSTELRLIQVLKDYGITGWRRNQKLIGRPDFVFRRQKLAVFVDGCFWHGCSKCYNRPGTNQDFWDAKFERNKKRDRRVNAELRKTGWRVIRIWEHRLAKPSGFMPRIIRAITR